MEGTPSAESVPSEGENNLRVENKITRSAATQTPELLRHPVILPSAQEVVERNGSNVSVANAAPVVILKVDYRNLGIHLNDETRTLSIPDVVIEYVKDTTSLKEIRPRHFEDVGMQNLAFDSSDESYQSPTREETSLSASDDNMVLFARPNQFAESLKLDSETFPISSGGRRLYYSLPRSTQQKHSSGNQVRLYSQPPSPRSGRSVQSNIEPIRSPSFTHPSTATTNATPSPDLSFRPQENGAAVYTISGRRTVVSNGMPDDIFAQDEKYFFQPKTNNHFQERSMSSEKFEFSPMPGPVDLKRRRLQFCTDSLSFFLLILGLLMAIGTPALLIPLFSAPTKMYIPIVGIFLAGGTLATMILSFSGIVGNIVWNYDEHNRKLKMRLHCGKGPIFHFWANGLYHLSQEAQNREMIV